MKIIIIGYGKMGKEVDKISALRGHEVIMKFTSADQHMLTVENLKKGDIVIEFTQPSSAVSNIKLCFDAGIPVVSGTTGWESSLSEMKEYSIKSNGALLHASNFSIGVNILFAMNEQLSMIMNNQPDYNVSIEETHHTQKLDEPSGTAITLANGIIGNLEKKNSWKLKSESFSDDEKNSDAIKITSFRRGEVIGTHSVTYESDIDFIQLSHYAKNRSGFAKGAVIAAEWLKDRSGVFTMKDLLNSFNKK